MDPRKSKLYNEFFAPVFIVPFQGTFDHFVAKFWLGCGFVVSFASIIQDGAIQEVELLGQMIAILPAELLLGLNLLILANWIIGTTKAFWGTLRSLYHQIRHKENLDIETFQISKWDRSIYKLLAYNGGGLLLGIVMNIFPDEFSLLQYAYYLVFCGKELHIGFTNLGLLRALIKMISLLREKGPDISVTDVLEHVQDGEKNE